MADQENKCRRLRKRLRNFLSDTWACNVMPDKRADVAIELGVSEDLLRDAHVYWASRRIKETGRVQEYIKAGKTYSYHHLQLSKEIFEELTVFSEARHTNFATFMVSIVHHYLQQDEWEPNYYRKWRLKDKVSNVLVAEGNKRYKFKLYWPFAILSILSKRASKLGMTRNGLFRSILCTVINDEAKKGSRGFGAQGTFPYITTRQMFSDVSRYKLPQISVESDDADEAE